MWHDQRYIIRLSLRPVFGEWILRGKMEEKDQEENIEVIHTGNDGDLDKEYQDG